MKESNERRVVSKIRRIQQQTTTAAARRQQKHLKNVRSDIKNLLPFFVFCKNNIETRKKIRFWKIYFRVFTIYNTFSIIIREVWITKVVISYLFSSAVNCKLLRWQWMLQASHDNGIIQMRKNAFLDWKVIANSNINLRMICRKTIK